MPLVAVFIVEMILRKDPMSALTASFGSVVGFLASTAAQAIVMIIMVLWFFLDIIFLKNKGKLSDSYCQFRKISWDISISWLIFLYSTILSILTIKAETT